MKKFNSFSEFEAWADKNDNHINTPVCIDMGNALKMDAEFKCKSFKTAIRRFAKAFSEINADINIKGWVESITEACENGYFEDHQHSDGNKNDYYDFGVEQTSDGWYIYLNIAGEYKA